jgi:hypothetical protein
MIIEQLAVLVYGVLAMIAAMILSSQVGSPIATALVFAAAGGTYVFQTLVLMNADSKLIGPIWIGVVAALLASVLVSLWSIV